MLRLKTEEAREGCVGCLNARAGSWLQLASLEGVSEGTGGLSFREPLGP